MIEWTHAGVLLEMGDMYLGDGVRYHVVELRRDVAGDVRITMLDSDGGSAVWYANDICHKLLMQTWARI